MPPSLSPPLFCLSNDSKRMRLMTSANNDAVYSARVTTLLMTVFLVHFWYFFGCLFIWWILHEEATFNANAFDLFSQHASLLVPYLCLHTLFNCCSLDRQQWARILLLFTRNDDTRQKKRHFISTEQTHSWLNPSSKIECSCCLRQQTTTTAATATIVYAKTKGKRT